jgi:hypothetical protein
LATHLDLPTLQIAYYAAGPTWKYTFWWREGNSEYAEAQFFARIAEEYSVLSVGVSIEKGLEDRDAARSAKRLMDRKIWDWERLKNRAKDLLRLDVPACASTLSRPLELRFYTHRYLRGKAGPRERRTFVFCEGAWFERHEGGAKPSTILDHVHDLDKRGDYWVNAQFGCDLFLSEVEGMTADAPREYPVEVRSHRERIRPKSVPRA